MADVRQTYRTLKCHDRVSSEVKVTIRTPPDLRKRARKHHDHDLIGLADEYRRELETARVC